MSQKKGRKKPTKHFRIMVLKDELGQDWDIYEERKTREGLMIYRGWLYGCSPSDGSASPVFSYVLTPDLADLIRNNSIKHVHVETGISLSTIAKMRVDLAINRNFVYRDDSWLREHKNEILFDSYKKLKEKYKLSRSQVNQHREWAAEIFSIEKRTRLRKTNYDESYDKWLNSEFNNLTGLSISDIMEKYKLSKYVATKTYNRYQKLKLILENKMDESIE